MNAVWFVTLFSTPTHNQVANALKIKASCDLLAITVFATQGAITVAEETPFRNGKSGLLKKPVAPARSGL
jgi:hypothetical protein